MPFDQPAELPSGGPAQASCVASGTGVYEGDNVADLTLTNCLGEPVSLHATCGQSKAHWLIGTAGWCTGALSRKHLRKVWLHPPLGRHDERVVSGATRSPGSGEGT